MILWPSEIISTNNINQSIPNIQGSSWIRLAKERGEGERNQWSSPATIYWINQAEIISNSFQSISVESAHPPAGQIDLQFFLLTIANLKYESINQMIDSLPTWLHQSETEWVN